MSPEGRGDYVLQWGRVRVNAESVMGQLPRVTDSNRFNGAAFV